MEFLFGFILQLGRVGIDRARHGLVNSADQKVGFLSFSRRPQLEGVVPYSIVVRHQDLLVATGNRHHDHPLPSESRMWDRWCTGTIVSYPVSTNRNNGI